MGPKTERLFFQRSQERREELSAECCQESAGPLRDSMDEEGQKVETGNLVLNPSHHWKPVECSEQCCCTCMPGLTKDKSGCMILYALRFVLFVVRDKKQEENLQKSN